MTLQGDSNLTNTRFDNPPEDGLEMMAHWLSEAQRVEVSEPLGFVLVTASNAGIPSSRVVLIKDCDMYGITFASSSLSLKGKEIDSNNEVAGTLWWRETVQQINLGGKVVKLGDAESDKVFRGRTRDAQAVATCSRQSQPLESEEVLRDQVQALIDSGDEIPRPENWRAYRIVPSSIEFWQGDASRLHKRLRYDRLDEGWVHGRLQP